MVVWPLFASCLTESENIAGLGGAGGSACVPSGGSTDGGSAIPPTFETVKTVLRGGGAVMPCSSAACHAVGSMAPPVNPLVLQNNADLYANMTSYVSKACGNMKLVNPGKPNESALIKILTGPCGMTPRMPYGCSTDACIPDAYVAALSQWIASCAPEQ
jgi:hypothetical protein